MDCQACGSAIEPPQRKFCNDDCCQAFYRSTRQQRLIRFGLTDDDIKALLQKQSNRCPVCNRFFPAVSGPSGRPGFNVDHDHKTGKVRGLLCCRCNSGLGKFQDSMRLLKRAQRYLEKS